MRVALFADKMVGLCIAEYMLREYPKDLHLVVTTERNEIFHLAEQAGMRACVFSPDGDLRARVAGADLGILAWWPKLIRSPLLAAPRFGFLNTHPSLLPHNRGKHPNFWAIVESAPFGVTLHRVDTGVDTGPIVAQKAIVPDWIDTGGTLYAKAQRAMVDLFCATYPRLRTGLLESKPQPESMGSYHHSSELETASRIDLEKSYTARDLLNLLRARTFEGHPGCWFEDGGQEYEIAISIRKRK